MSGLDHGILNVPLAKRGRSLDAQIDAHLAEQRRQDKAEWDARRKAARDAEAERVRLTREDITGARFVRTSVGWHVVVRVSAKSVTVKTPYSWTDRYAFDKVLEVKR